MGYKTRPSTRFNKVQQGHGDRIADARSSRLNECSIVVWLIRQHKCCRVHAGVGSAPSALHAACRSQCVHLFYVCYRLEIDLSRMQAESVNNLE